MVDICEFEAHDSLVRISTPLDKKKNHKLERIAYVGAVPPESTVDEKVEVFSR